MFNVADVADKKLVGDNSVANALDAACCDNIPLEFGLTSTHVLYVAMNQLWSAVTILRYIQKTLRRINHISVYTHSIG